MAVNPIPDGFHSIRIGDSIVMMEPAGPFYGDRNGGS